ncbi:MAG: hypothetical protein M0Z58_08645 [Nitrospiraceae bacterium]|nr:hypothetical protein [Nitrospiraceae bacterium]
MIAGTLIIIGIIAAIFAGFYFLIARPMRKKYGKGVKAYRPFDVEEFGYKKEFGDVETVDILDDPAFSDMPGNVFHIPLMTD